MDHRIELSPTQLAAVKRRIGAVENAQARLQMLSVQFTAAQEAMYDIVALLAEANGIESYGKQCRLEGSVLVMPKLGVPMNHQEA